jgi:hypothetical protein
MLPLLHKATPATAEEMQERFNLMRVLGPQGTVRVHEIRRGYGRDYLLLDIGALDLGSIERVTAFMQRHNLMLGIDPFRIGTLAMWQR